jgi:hypothetical protein
MMRLGIASVAVLALAQVAVYSPDALPSMILAAALVAVVFVVEETRVREARRAEHFAEEHACRHGGTSFRPHDEDGGER